jgi:hypothetical protein
MYHTYVLHITQVKAARGAHQSSDEREDRRDPKRDEPAQPNPRSAETKVQAGSGKKKLGKLKQSRGAEKRSQNMKASTLTPAGSARHLSLNDNFTESTR